MGGIIPVYASSSIWSLAPVADPSETWALPSPPFCLNLLQLAYCVVQFLEKESSLTEPVIPPRSPSAHLCLSAAHLCLWGSAISRCSGGMEPNRWLGFLSEGE